MLPTTYWQKYGVIQPEKANFTSATDERLQNSFFNLAFLKLINFDRGFT